MSATLDELDQSLRLATTERNRRLRAWIHSPNADTSAALTQAVAELDAKLEERFAVQ